MAKWTVSMAHDAEKAKRINEIMAKEDLDVIISRYTENVLYFTNVWPITGWGIAVIYKDKDPILFLPESEMDFTGRAIVKEIESYTDTSVAGVELLVKNLDVKRGARIGLELSKEGLAGSHLGYEVAFPNRPSFESVARALPDCTIVDATPAIDEMREVKSTNDLKQLALVNEMNYYGLDAASELLHTDGISEMEIATGCEKAIMDAIKENPAVEFIRAYAFVMAGPNGIKASRPYNISTAYRCKRGEYVMIELNTQVNGWWSDLTRTWVCGRNPTPAQKDQEDAVSAAIEAAFKAMRPGLSWRGAYEASRQAIVERHQGQHHTPFLGHGIGAKLHEKVPMMHGGVDEKHKFQAGHYCSVEPGLYIEGMGALRFERNVAVLDGRVEATDEFPCTL
ncbi:MAG: aminopeptidase P family protein [Candidatus Lokiarchaeota archaeon]|nr:aminopeptidase P family protein [Candidatus Lokiarchaeota archaeon]